MLILQNKYHRVNSIQGTIQLNLQSFQVVYLKKGKIVARIQEFTISTKNSKEQSLQSEDRLVKFMSKISSLRCYLIRGELQKSMMSLSNPVKL